MTARNSALTALSAIALATALPACAENHNEGAMETLSIEGSDGTMLTGTVLEEFGAPWAMTFLPDDRALVTEKTGELWLLNKDGSKAGMEIIAKADVVLALGTRLNPFSTLHLCRFVRLRGLRCLSACHTRRPPSINFIRIH